MNKSDFFEHEIAWIEDDFLKDFVRFFFNEYTGDWFFTDGASASGKFHPVFSHGEGGLVRHTKAAAWFLEDLLRLSSYSYMPDIYKDYARVAILLHDTRKYGKLEFDKRFYTMHGIHAANAVRAAWDDFFNNELPCPDLLLMAIRSHMGQWTTPPENKPFTNIDRVVHLADYISSRSFIDIPEIVEDYNKVKEGA